MLHYFADLVAEQLEKRIAFRRAIREALQRAQKQNVNGIKIQVSPFKWC
jgi:small subunit ribosomal protein S3